LPECYSDRSSGNSNTMYQQVSKPNISTKTTNTETTLETFVTLLKDCVCQLADESSNDIFILVDAFDEFQTKGNERTERRRLQNCLHELTETKKARLLITTRPEPLESLRSTFKNSAEVEIRADPGDIDKYIDKEMEGYLGSRNVELKESLKSRVRERSEGLYRPF
jgi:hypothetical protein